MARYELCSDTPTLTPNSGNESYLYRSIPCSGYHLSLPPLVRYQYWSPHIQMGRCRSKKTLSLCFGLVVSRCSCIKLCCPFVRGLYFIHYSPWQRLILKGQTNPFWPSLPSFCPGGIFVRERKRLMNPALAFLPYPSLALDGFSFNPCIALRKSRLLDQYLTLQRSGR